MRTFYYFYKSTSKSKLWQINLFEMLTAILMKTVLTVDTHPRFGGNIGGFTNVFGKLGH